MKHQQKNPKFGRKKGQRAAFTKSLLTNLITHERITTSEARAKLLKQNADKLVTLAKKQNLASLRLLIARLTKKPAMKMYYDIAPRFADRKGGYTRIIKISSVRKGDASARAIVEFVDAK